MKNEKTEQVAPFGLNLRSEGNKALHRALFFAFALVLAHLLDIKPSKIDAGGITIAIADVSIIYGTIALIFGYHLSRAISQIDQADAYFPLNPTPHRLRSNIRVIRRLNKHKTSPKSIKRNVRATMVFTDLVLFPYRIIFALLMLIAVLISALDLTNFGFYLWENSAAIADVWKMAFE